MKNDLKKSCPKCRVILPAGTMMCPFCAAPKGTVRIWWDTQSQDAIIEASNLLSRATAPDSLLGTTFDNRYQIHQVIGYGGMATVYFAEHLEIGRNVALKIFHTQFFQERKVDEHFCNEAAAASRISHPGIVATYEVNRTLDGTRFIALEYVSGNRLSDEIEHHSQLSWYRACDIGIQLANALDHVHQNGVVHCDLKPDNILLATYGETGSRYSKLYDFGTSAIIDDHHSATASIPGTSMMELVGTPDYMAPEQLSGHPAKPGTDIFSLGVVLHQMITGSLPFDSAQPELGVNLAQTRRRKLNSNPDLPHVPQELLQLVDEMLAEEPNHRPREMAEVVTRLRHVLTTPGATKVSWQDLTDPVSSTASISSPAPSKRDNTVRIYSK